MRFWKNGIRNRRVVWTVLAALLATGCATDSKRAADPRDPLETYNRGFYRFNSDFDKAFLRPIAKGYKAITPAPVNRGITNFFNNLDDVTSLINNVLQFKMMRAGSDLGRLLVNSTAGIAGVMDVATNVGLPSYKEDFGQTLGYWGIPPGPYFMLPIFGPSDFRDTIGFAGDIVTDPSFGSRLLWGAKHGHIFWGLSFLEVVDFRADRLEAGDILEDAAPDPYVFLRDAYLQRRQNLVYDGNPPETETQEDIWADVELGGNQSPAPAKSGAPSPARPGAETPKAAPKP
jgi:phospholipid-binding lipoprotein MlaA